MKTWIWMPLALLPLACSAGADVDAVSDEQGLHEKPTDDEIWSDLTILLPTGTCAPGQSCSHPLGVAETPLVDGKPLGIGTKLRVKAGEHQISLNGAAITGTFVGGVPRTITLGVAHRKCTALSLPNVPNTDFGATVSVANAACPSIVARDGVKMIVSLYGNRGCFGSPSSGFDEHSNAGSCLTSTSNYFSYAEGGACRDLGAGGESFQPMCSSYLAGDSRWGTTAIADADRAFLPGNYTASVSTGAKTSFTLNEGDTSAVTIALPVVGNVPATFVTNLVFDDSRDNPTVGAPTITSSCSGDRSYTVSASATGTVALRAFQAAACTYTLKAGGRAQVLHQSTTDTVHLERLDVDDVQVTREDGTTYTTRGSYEIYFGGARVAGPYATSTGLDLLPGTYELVLTYATADGSKTQHKTMSL